MWMKVSAVLIGLWIGLWITYDNKHDTIKGKRVVVTGASSGIGEQLAYQYARLGASVVVTARRQELLNKVADKCRSLGPSNATYTAISADMKDRQSIEDLVKESVQQLGGLDIVILNHITISSIALFTGNPQDLDKVYNTMDINFRSYIDTTAYVLPHLTKSEGNLVVVNSLAGTIHNPKLAAYSASKFALNGFYDSLRSQFKFEGKNIALTSCVLGFIDTETAKEGISASGTRVKVYAQPAAADETALAILTGTARREEKVYHPSVSIRAMVFIHSLCPSLTDWMMRYLMVVDAH